MLATGASKSVVHWTLTWLAFGVLATVIAGAPTLLQRYTRSELFCSATVTDKCLHSPSGLHRSYKWFESCETMKNKIKRRMSKTQLDQTRTKQKLMHKKESQLNQMRGNLH